jgi:hypothetical protein
MATEESIWMSGVYFEPAVLNQTRIGFKKTNHLKTRKIKYWNTLHGGAVCHRHWAISNINVIMIQWINSCHKYLLLKYYNFIFRY